MQLLNTLYVTLPDSRLRLDNDTLRVEQEQETRLRVPLHHLQAETRATRARANRFSVARLSRGARGLKPAGTRRDRPGQRSRASHEARGLKSAHPQVKLLMRNC